ncbi:hypothetical protein TNCT_201911 [Trichonephila clavata]|uniref:Uncharacterized protein n=1 Tax=Trichonephila clavata TaxID=2740835 RepID=A0A8X6H4Z9_TRICU|nr:hypothetical protein TNCT_201911 [Trichonephila clavata]
MAEAQTFELLKKKRKSFRTAVTKVVNELEAELSNSDLNVDRLSELNQNLQLFKEIVHLQNLPTESSSILQPSLIFDSIKLQSTTSQENIEIFEPDVSDNNDSTEDANILNENDASTNNYQMVCVFCNREHKKLRSKMLPLHKADTNQFKSSVLPNIEGQEEYAELLNKLKKFSVPKISYHTECRVNFNNKISF